MGAVPLVLAEAQEGRHLVVDLPVDLGINIAVVAHQEQRLVVGGAARRWAREELSTFWAKGVIAIGTPAAYTAPVRLFTTGTGRVLRSARVGMESKFSDF